MSDISSHSNDDNVMNDSSSCCGFLVEQSDDATALSSSINSFVLRRMQSSALLKWQTGGSSSHHRPSAKEGTEIAISYSNLEDEDNDDDDLLDNDDDFSQRDSFANADLNDDAASACRALEVMPNTTSQNKSYHKLLSKKLGNVQNLLDEDSLSEDDTLNGSSSSFSWTSDCVMPATRQARSVSPKATKDRSGAAPLDVAPRKARSASPVNNSSNPGLRRLKSCETPRKTAVCPKKMRKVVSDVDQYRNTAVSPRPCRATMEANKNKRVAALSAASSHSPKSSSKRCVLKRAVSDLGRKGLPLDDGSDRKNADFSISKDKAAKRNLIKRSVSSMALSSSSSTSSQDKTPTMPKRSPRTSIVSASNDCPKSKLTRSVSTRSVSGNSLTRSLSPAKRPGGRRKLQRSTSSKSDSPLSSSSCHARLAPKKPARRQSKVLTLPKATSSRSLSPTSTKDSLPSYDWKQGKPITSPSA